MRIQHNISALNAANNMKTNENAISKNIAKLSSGYRINSAADDAAGLAVSEKMRSQINGLQQAESNAENGISLVQTAEGGLNETSSILQRMNTLAVESSNGTYQNDTDRANLQKEVNALKDEVNRISTSTNFNQINLLDGSLGSDTSTLKATVELSSTALANQAFTMTDATYGTFTVAAAATDGHLNTTPGVTKEYDYDISYTDQNGKAQTLSVALTIDGANKKITDASGACVASLGASNTALTTEIADAVYNTLAKNTAFTSEFNISASTGAGGTGIITFKAKTKGADGGSITGVQTDNYSITGAANVASLSMTVSAGYNAHEGTNVADLTVYDSTQLRSSASDAVFTVNGQAFAFVTHGGSVASLNAEGVNTILLATDGSTDYANGISKEDLTNMANLINSKTGLSVQADLANGVLEYISKTNTTSNGALTLQIGSDNTADQRANLAIGDMSCKGLGIQNVSVATQQDAQKAIDTIKAAINSVDGTRADLGALQNELEHTSNNLSTMNQNLTSAESNIRDVDMSDEYVQYSKNQILSQAAQSMLAQANSQPQGILNLLRG